MLSRRHVQALKRRVVALREDLRWAENAACGRRVLRRLGTAHEDTLPTIPAPLAGTAGSGPRSEDDAEICDLEQPRPQPLGRPKRDGAQDQMFRATPTLGLFSSHGRVAEMAAWNTATTDSASPAGVKHRRFVAAMLVRLLIVALALVTAPWPRPPAAKEVLRSQLKETNDRLDALEQRVDKVEYTAELQESYRHLQVEHAVGVASIWSRFGKPDHSTGGTGAPRGT